MSQNKEKREMSFTTRGRQGGIASPGVARAAAVAAEINRAQAHAPAGPIARAPKKDKESLFEKDEDKVKPDFLDGDDKDKDKDKKKTEKAASAGSAGDFTSMPGSLEDPFDNNKNKGNKPADNDTGDPATPSGI
jgi:hypothetical protein